MKKTASIALSMILAASIVFAPTLAVYADEEKKPLHAGISNNKQGTSNSSFDQFSLEPGETVTKSFSFYNLGYKDFKVSLDVTPYSVTDEEYTEDHTTQTIHTNISRWITFPRNNFTMKATSEENQDYVGHEVIEYTVSVPDDAPAGVQRARIIVTASLEDEADSNMLKEVSIGYTVLANVKGGVSNLDIRLTQQDIPFFYFAGPIGDTVRVENTGNVDGLVRHQTVIRNFFNDSLAYDSGKSDYFVLADTTRLILSKWDGSPYLGIFKVTSTVTIGSEVHEIEKVSIIVPFFVIILIILFLVLAIVWLISRRKKSGKKGKASAGTPSWEQN